MNKIFEQVVNSIKELFARFGIDTWFAGMNIDSAEVARSGVLFFGGTLFGIIMKKYAKIIFITVGVTVAVIKGLEYQNLLVLDYTGFKTTFGIDTAVTLNSLGGDIYCWICGNVVPAISLLIGFLIGLKLG